MRLPILYFIVLALALPFAQQTLADAPDPTQVYIKRITYAGSGCPTGTMRQSVSEDAKAMTLIFDEFNAEAGPGVPGGRNSSSCRVIVDLRFPAGWSYTLFDVVYQGFVNLDSSVSALKRSAYFFQTGSTNPAVFEKKFVGPIADNFQEIHAYRITDLNWSPCGQNRALNIDTTIKVNNTANPANSGLLTVDTIDGELRHIYGIQWTRCP